MGVSQRWKFLKDCTKEDMKKHVKPFQLPSRHEACWQKPLHPTICETTIKNPTHQHLPNKTPMKWQDRSAMHTVCCLSRPIPRRVARDTTKRKRQAGPGSWDGATASFCTPAAPQHTQHRTCSTAHGVQNAGHTTPRTQILPEHTYLCRCGCPRGRTILNPNHKAKSQRSVASHELAPSTKSPQETFFCAAACCNRWSLASTTRSKRHGWPDPAGGAFVWSEASRTGTQCWRHPAFCAATQDLEQVSSETTKCHWRHTPRWGGHGFGYPPLVCSSTVLPVHWLALELRAAREVTQIAMCCDVPQHLVQRHLFYG